MRMKKVFALLLTGMMTVSAPAAVFASSTEEQIADDQAQKDAAQAELAQEQANMASLESKKQELESYLEELNAQYTDLTNSVSELGIQAAEKEDELKAQLEEAKATSDKQYEDMKKRIVYMYENGSASMLELLLSSEDLAQFLNRAENIAQISQYDRDMLAKYKALQADIKAQEEQAEEDAQNIDQLLAEKSAKQQEVQALTASTSEDIQAYIYQISASQEDISALNTQIDNADSSIYSLLQAAEAEKAAEEAAAQEASASAEDAADHSESESSDESEDYSEGSYEDTEESGSSDQSYTEDSESSDSSQTSESESSSSSQGTYLGTFTLTAYCNCAQCCGTAGNLTASGTVPAAGRTVAMAGVPFGTQLLINGTVYTVEDLGTPYGHVDIYCSSHSEALAFGLQSAEVYRLN